ncbi:MAG TPA: c-type cytochrome [Planctomycetaceae bacterium]|nr:c-type cytochrome [Planctomycetaceae bacterium]
MRTSFICLVMCLVHVADVAGQDTLESVDRVRGGRHWIDAKVDPPKSAKESKAKFRIEPGFRVELVASEPLVFDPVAIAFDHLGQMFVVEYGDYPTGPEEKGAPPLSRVVLLTDRDGDGVMDERFVFADQLNFAHSLLPVDDGILVGAQNQIVFLKDSTGDHRADIREVWFEGFVAAHPQMQIGNPRWGFDNWIYLNYGPGEIVRRRGAGGDIESSEPVTMPRLDFRFHPRTMEFEADNGLGQFGNTIDKYGYRFFTTNRNPIMVRRLTRSEAQRNPFVSISRGHVDVGPAGGDTRVYPLVAMKSNWLSHAGTHTSACGVTAYTGDLFGSEPDQSSVFVCEPVGHLVTRSIVYPDGSGLNARRAEPKADFLASSDTWFRPASLATGPDGALYLADMYRMWVEHPKFLPPDIAARIDWRAGEDRGRIWRIVPERKKASTFRPPQDDDDLLALLRDPNGWRRRLGQRLIVEGQMQNLVPRLRAMLEPIASGNVETAALTRLHALWTLHGLAALTDDDLTRLLRDPGHHLRLAAVQLLAPRLAGNKRLVELVGQMAGDDEPRVRYQVALAMGESASEKCGSYLTSLAKSDGIDEWFATAILTSSRQCSGAILQGLFADPKIASRPQYGDIVRRLAEVVGARGDAAELKLVLDALAPTADKRGAWWQTVTLRGLATGLPRYRGELGRLSLASLLSGPPTALEESMGPIRELMKQTQEVSLDSQRSSGDRVAATELMAFQSPQQTLGALRRLLSSAQPVEVQRAAIEGLRRVPEDDAMETILTNWSSLGPSLRGPALELLMARKESTRATLVAMKAGTLSAAAVGVERRIRLLRHADAEIKQLAIDLFGGAVSADRVAVAKQYEAALTIDASMERGIEVFRKTCASCHRVDGVGHDVGPDISDVRNRARDALLYDILDPNRKVEPRFNDYTVITIDGIVINGLLVTETAKTVVLRQAENKQVVIQRDQIDEMHASGKSLMPEGVEKTVSVQQMADLLEYLKQRTVRSAAGR